VCPICSCLAMWYIYIYIYRATQSFNAQFGWQATDKAQSLINKRTRWGTIHDEAGEGQNNYNRHVPPPTWLERPNPWSAYLVPKPAECSLLPACRNVTIKWISYVTHVLLVCRFIFLFAFTKWAQRTHIWDVFSVYLMWHFWNKITRRI
jgi:hypothetical protein